jgi:hypothetical protein
MAITTKSDMIDVQILMDVVRGKLRGKNAFMGSVLVQSGAVRVSGTMPKSGASAIGKKIDIPYFGSLGEFVQNSDGNSVTPSKLGQVLEQATIDRYSLAAEVSRWAQGVGAIDPSAGDPYEEAASQIIAAASRAMDGIMITEMSGTELVVDVYSASNPVYLDWDLIVDATTLWGDEQDNIVGMALHSQSRADVAKLKDSAGKPLLLLDQKDGQQSVTRFAGVPLVLSDRVALTGSSMTSAMGSTGTTPPAITLAGTPLGPWKLVIDVVTGGLSNGTATFRFSVDGGNIWSATYTIPNGGGAFVLDDSSSAAVADINGNKTADSLVGVNGKTGITATFTNGTYNADNLYKSIANLKVTDLICQEDAGAFWYNAAALALKSDEDILADTDITAAHLYHAAKRYRRRRGGSRPGVIAIKHNVRGYVGGTTF